MSRYRLVPSPAQEGTLRDHCAHARFVWNLAVEQHSHWRRSRASAPGYLEQCRQLTAAREEHPWLAAGSQMVQQQALRDFAQAMANFFAGTHRRPTWRKAFSSQRCSACGHVDAKSRESQARFVCTACSFACNADVNAARNIAAGLAVTARGGDGVTRPVNRDPQLLLQSA
jgi:transposase